MVQWLRNLCCVVEVISDVGRGLPDLLVKTPRGRIALAEVKDPNQPLSKQKLTPLELEVQRRWGDSYVVLKTHDDAIALART